MNSEFNFFQQWYPLSPVEDLDPNCPNRVMLLGLRLVIWKGIDSKDYTVFLDKCPHRLAPLSEGRIEPKTGNLMCSYHGWEFNQEGICTRIPQADNPQIVTKNQKNFCVEVFPAQIANDLLWVWADSQSPELAKQTPLPLSPQIDVTKGFVWTSYVRDLEYDWQTLVENVTDPSHVPFAHHGVQGNREKAHPIDLNITKSTPNLIEAEVQGNFKTTITFEPPCRLEYTIGFGEKGKQIGLIVYCIPTAPGKSRLVAQNTRNFAQKLQQLTPRWWDHLHNRNLVIDGDMILLHQQERFLQEQLTQKSWPTAYKLPTSADRLVIAFRQWFDKYCHGKLPWSAGCISSTQQLPINENREQLLDRYHQHTQHCSSCRGALKNIQRLEKVLFLYFVVAITILAGLSDEWRAKIALLTLASAYPAVIVAAWLKFRLEPKFYFVDYVHAAKK
jgi:phenylpropionate dioxygenase-like ring-hydroxylating dioxygenase large terminal subunit